MFHGASCFFVGLKLLTRSGLRRFVVIPIIINVAIFAIVLWFGMQWFDQFLSSMLPEWLSWAEFILWPLFAISYFLIVFYLFALLINVIAAPFNSLLAEKVEQHLRGHSTTETNENYVQLLKEIPRSIANELSKLLYFLIRSIPLLLLFVIPGINIIAPLLWLIFSAWMLSLEYLDYPLGNHSVNFRTTRILASQQRMSCLSYGAVVAGFTMIPIINFIAMPAAVAGATVLYVNSMSQQAKSIAESQ